MINDGCRLRNCVTQLAVGMLLVNFYKMESYLQFIDTIIPGENNIAGYSQLLLCHIKIIGQQIF